MRWSPSEYARYADERGRPYGELVARVGASTPARVVDVGCGPGPLTAGLAQRWPDARIEGLDSSPEMIDEARPRATDRLSFHLADAGAWQPDGVDVVVSNATLQWVPDHLSVLARWAAAVPPGGWLAMQVPGNFRAPSHTIMRELAAEPRFADRLRGVLRHDDAVAEPDAYARLLLDAGLAADVWETTYSHVLAGPDPVLRWVRGTGLRPVLAALDDTEAEAFSSEYAARLRQAYPSGPHGTVFAFRRIFAVGYRA